MRKDLAGMLEGDYKLEYIDIDVSYDFHIDKLYKFNAMPGAQLEEMDLQAP